MLWRLNYIWYIGPASDATILYLSSLQESIRSNFEAPLSSSFQWFSIISIITGPLDLVLNNIISVQIFLKYFCSSIKFALPTYWSVSCPQVSHVHPCILIVRSLVHKSPMFILAFFLVDLLSTSLPCSSLPSYCSGSCPQVTLFHPCLLFGLYFFTRLPFSSLPYY